MIDPQIVATLSQETPEFIALRKHLAEEANKLNTLEGLDSMDFKERSYEVTARLRAFEKLQAILEPLDNLSTPLAGFNASDYVIE